MIIVNAVECTKISALQSMVDSYLDNNPKSVIYTDDLKIKQYADINYPERCVYNESLVALWLRIVDTSILIITDIENVCSEVYRDLSNNYTITCIEESDTCEIDTNKELNFTVNSGGE